MLRILFVAAAVCVSAAFYGSWFYGGLPGQVADASDVASVRAGARGICTTRNACTANVLPATKCVLDSTGNACASTAGGAACGSCTGQNEKTCDGSNETLCNETYPACCQVRTECHTVDSGGGGTCDCVSDGAMQWIGTKATC